MLIVALSSSARLEYNVVVLPEPVGSGDQKDSVRLVHDLAEPRQRFVRHAEVVQVQAPGLFVEQPQHDALAVAGRHRRNAHVDLSAANPKRDAAILRHSLLCDVELRHDLDPRNQQRRERALRLHDFPHDTVYAKAHHQLLLERLDVNVGRVLADCFGKQRVDQPDDRRIVFLIEQVFRLGYGIRQARKVELVAHVFDHLPRLRRVARIGRREDGLELLVGDLPQCDGSTGEAPQLRQNCQVGLFAVGNVDRTGAIGRTAGNRYAESSRKRERQQARARFGIRLDNLTHILATRQVVHPARKRRRS